MWIYAALLVWYARSTISACGWWVGVYGSGNGDTWPSSARWREWYVSENGAADGVRAMGIYGHAATWREGSVSENGGVDGIRSMGIYGSAMKQGTDGVRAMGNMPPGKRERKDRSGKRGRWSTRDGI